MLSRLGRFGGLFLLFFSFVNVLKAADEFSFHPSSESGYFEKLRIIEEALSGSTVIMGYFIIEDDLSTSYLISRMQNRALKDGVKFQILVDYAMSEARVLFYRHLASLPGFELKRMFPPLDEFRIYLTDELRMQNSAIFLKGLALQNKEFIIEGFKSSDLLKDLFQRWISSRNSVEAPTWSLLIDWLLDAKTVESVTALQEFPRHLESFSYRFHHKFMAAETSRGLAFIMGGRNLSDEYHVSMSTEVGEKILNTRSYPFFDAEFSGAISSRPFSQYHDSFARLWNAPASLVTSITPLYDDAVAQKIIEAAHSFEAALIHLQDRAASKTLSWKSSFENIRYIENLQTILNNQRDITKAWLAEIEKAETKVTIVSAYFYFFPELYNSIKTAIERGVQVDIYTNSYESTDMNIVNIGAYQQFDAWMNGISEDSRSRLKIHELQMPSGQKGSLHAKLMRVDDRVLILGSANFDPRTHLFDTNNAFVIQTETPDARQAADELLRSFLIDLQWSVLDSVKISEKIKIIKETYPLTYRATQCAWLIRQL